MKTFKLHLVCFAAIAILISGISLTYAQTEPAKVKVEVEMKSGDQVTLFYGGSGNIKKDFPVGKVIKVYARNRAFGLNYNQMVGKVKILSFEGENFIKAQVVEGIIHSGDVVKIKPGAGPGVMVAPPIPTE